MSNPMKDWNKICPSSGIPCIHSVQCENDLKCYTSKLSFVKYFPENFEIETKPKVEMVNHPAHYGGRDNPYETIKVIRMWFTQEQFYGFLLGNALKYQSRAGKKDALQQDIEKADWYLTYLKVWIKETGYEPRTVVSK